MSSEPITAARLERCLDRIAEIITADRDGGRVYLPIYARLECELAEHHAAEELMAAAQQRVRRLRDRMIARS